MASAVFIILLFSGLWALAWGVSRQFYLVKVHMEWKEAQRQCREKYTDLATIENEEEMNAVKELLKGKKVKKFWIGLKRHKTSWVWSDKTPFKYANWHIGEPNNKGEENCVEVYKRDNKWNDKRCNQANQFICYKKRSPITVITEKKTWGEALRFCRQNHKNLLSVQSKEMQDWVEHVTKNLTTDLWIGLHHTCDLDFWYWVSGQIMMCYQNWAQGNGTGVEDCNSVERTGALLGESKKWVSLPQTQELYFICITF